MNIDHEFTHNNLTTLDDDLEQVRAIPVVSNDSRVLFARQVNQ